VELQESMNDIAGDKQDLKQRAGLKYAKLPLTLTKAGENG
jgi:hypothetical protein